MRNRLTGLFGFLIFIFLAFSVASMYVKPNEKDILAMFGLIFPFIYIVAIVSLPLLYYKQKLTFFLIGILIATGVGSFLSYAKPQIFNKGEQGELHVMSFNAMMGFMLQDKPQIISDDRLFEIKQKLLSPKPDIVALQEANGTVTSLFKELLGYQYIHKLPQRGAAIISKYPIFNNGHVDFGPKLNSCVWADINVNNDTVRIYSLHLESNRLKPSSYEFLIKDKYGSLDAIEGIKDFALKYPTYAGMRAEQALRVKDHINESPYPVIVGGDLNDPPVSYTYKTLKKGLTDTFLKSGGGFGTTWSGAVPMLRIDYIFASKSLNNTSYKCVESDFSDHFPVNATFNFK